MRFSGVDQRIVDVGHRRPEAQAVNGPTQPPGNTAWIFHHTVPEFHPAMAMEWIVKSEEVELGISRSGGMMEWGSGEKLKHGFHG